MGRKIFGSAMQVILHPDLHLFAGQNMPNIAKDCHENEKNTLDKNRLKASKYVRIEVFTKMIKILFVCHLQGFNAYAKNGENKPFVLKRYLIYTLFTPFDLGRLHSF